MGIDPEERLLSEDPTFDIVATSEAPAVPTYSAVAVPKGLFTAIPSDSMFATISYNTFPAT